MSLALLAGAYPAPVAAAPAWMQPQPIKLAPQQLAPTATDRGISVERAARIARRQTGGRVLSTNRVRRGSEAGVEVRLLINGSRVTKVFVDGDGEVRGR
ncbi:MAG: PepSY domain-containing protein [Pseudomonadales bacterium]